MSSDPARPDPPPEIHPVNARLATYLINLDRAPERGLRMARLMQRRGLYFERVSAIDGNRITLPLPEFDERGYLHRHGRRPNRFEIGCYLSHVECARRLLASPAQHALVLEDDLDFADDFTDVLMAALDKARHWDILRLSTVSSGRKFNIMALGSDRSLAIALTREKGSGAYLINRKAARWLTTVLMPMRLPYDIAFDLEHEAGLRACFVMPLVVSQSAVSGSDIQKGRWQYRMKRGRPLVLWLHRARMEGGRFAARLARLVLWKILGAPRA